MSISPERYCLGGLMKDIDKEMVPEDLEKDISNDETTYKSSQEQNFSSTDSSFSFPLATNFFMPALNKYPLEQQQKQEEFNIFSKHNIFMAFNNQRSTKMLQKNLSNASKETIDSILEELNGAFRSIIKNKNGNYFCSDLLKVCNNEQRIKILKELSSTISEDSTDEFGTHPIQNLIELASCEEEYTLLLSSFKDYNKILMNSLNQNGSFVIQKLIVHIPERFRMEFNLIFVKFICILSRDMFGVCTVKKFIGYTKNELIVKQVLNSILTNFVNIAENQYGNYLVQYLLEKWWKTGEGMFLKKLIISKFKILAANHYSSYICDLFLKLCNNEEKKALINCLTNYKPINKNNNFKGKIPLYLNNITKDLGKKEEVKDKTIENSQENNNM